LDTDICCLLGVLVLGQSGFGDQRLYKGCLCCNYCTCLFEIFVRILIKFNISFLQIFVKEFWISIKIVMAGVIMLHSNGLLETRGTLLYLFEGWMFLIIFLRIIYLYTLISRFLHYFLFISRHLIQNSNNRAT